MHVRSPLAFALAALLAAPVAASAAQQAASAALNAAWASSMPLRVSAVPPDLEMTMTRVCLSFDPSCLST